MGEPSERSVPGRAIAVDGVHCGVGRARAHGRGRGRGRWAAWAVVVVIAGGCGPRTRRPAHITWARTPAVGTPEHCPDDAIDLTGDGIPTTDRTRCSYADASSGQVRVHGKVLDAPRAGAALGAPRRDVEVELRQVDAHGVWIQTLGRATTDSQGGFTIRGNLRLPRKTPGYLEVRAGDGRSERWQWEGRGPWHRDDVRVLVPAPAADGAPRE